MGVRVLRDDEILIGKATGDTSEAVAVSALAPTLADKTPLWAYILAESTATAYRVVNGAIVGAQRAPFRLGPVGSRIVAETFIGLLASDPNSIINVSQMQGQANTLRQLFDQVSQSRPVVSQGMPPRDSARQGARQPQLRPQAPRRRR